MSNTRVAPVDSDEASNVRLFRDTTSPSVSSKEWSSKEGPQEVESRDAVTVSSTERRQRAAGVKSIQILQDKKFTTGATKSYGSRMVGGKKPTDLEVYKKFESVSYLTPDTAEQESKFMRMTPSQSGRLRSLLWIRYTITGVVVSLTIAGALNVCGIIEKARVKMTTKLLDKAATYPDEQSDYISQAWLFWVGTSLGMNLFAVSLVLLQPAAASSGIPGLISFLNGVEPPGGKSPITKKNTSFVSVRTLVAKQLGMLASIPSGLCIGPEGPIIHISALLAYWTTRVIHSFEAKLWGKSYDEDTEHERRDFLATGAACGICTAFRAPLQDQAQAHVIVREVYIGTHTMGVFHLPLSLGGYRLHSAGGHYDDLRWPLHAYVRLIQLHEIDIVCMI